MIAGMMSESLEAIVSIVVRGPEGAEQTIDAAVDSGFNGRLLLPLSIVQQLGCNWETLEEGILADGSKEMFDVFTAIILWDGQERRVFVSATSRGSLIGMSLLEGYEVKMEVRPGGKVTIPPLE